MRKRASLHFLHPWSRIAQDVRWKNLTEDRMKIDVFERCWFDLWKRIGAKGDAGAVYRDLVVCYADTTRAYHTLTHVHHCLTEYARVSTQYEHVEFALWFHDAVYDVRRGDNEEASALLATSILREARVAEQFVEDVSRLILKTKHDAVSSVLDEQLIVDVDLSIFGQPWEKFNLYERQIREEYRSIPEDIYRRERTKILKAFLARPAIFSTLFFHHYYEKTARVNLKRSLMRLST
jgi:predicted metal-dependent HD superfamily phosphohydrolase